MSFTSTRLPSSTCSSLAQYLAKERYDKRVLSIQSHVVSGFVGNKCAVFPLQLHGFEVDTINSVQFSNHTQYPKGARGQRLNERDLVDLFDGLRNIDLPRKYSHILTGYCGDASFLRQIASIIRECRNLRPNLVYVCDPVMGDHGNYYNGMPPEMCDIYRNEILPLADVITPNAFELSELSGIVVNSEESCLRAIARIHNVQRVRIVVMTSGILSAPDREECIPPKSMYCYASECINEMKDNTTQGNGNGGNGNDVNVISSTPSAAGVNQQGVHLQQYRFEIPLIRGTFVGTGDLFTALLLAWLEETGGQLCRALRATISSMQAVLNRTSTHAFAQSNDPCIQQRELRLTQSRLDLLKPEVEAIDFIEIHKMPK